MAEENYIVYRLSDGQIVNWIVLDIENSNWTPSVGTAIEKVEKGVFAEIGGKRIDKGVYEKTLEPVIALTDEEVMAMNNETALKLMEQNKAKE